MAGRWRLAVVVGGVLLAALAFVQGQYLEYRLEQREQERERAQKWDETVERRRQNPLQPARPAARKVVYKSRCEYEFRQSLQPPFAADDSYLLACDRAGLLPFDRLGEFLP